LIVSSVALASIALATGCQNRCEAYGHTAAAKYKECGLWKEQPQTGHYSPPAGEQPKCDEQMARRSDCYSQCVSEASCAALAGTDQGAARAWGECLMRCGN
jgi:hypothetical protein